MNQSSLSNDKSCNETVSLSSREIEMSVEHKKRKRSKQFSSPDSFSDRSDSSRRRSEKKYGEARKKKRKKSNRDSSRERKKKEKRLLKKQKKEKKKKKSKCLEINKNEEETKCSMDVPFELMDKTKAMAPMTKEEWDKKQSVMRRVLDESTGRYRLVKGDGEIMEEIVSKERHNAINQQATKGDGEFFQSKLKQKLN